MTVGFFKNAKNNVNGFVTVEKYCPSVHWLCTFLYHCYRVAILMNDFLGVTVLRLTNLSPTLMNCLFLQSKTTTKILGTLQEYLCLSQ